MSDRPSQITFQAGGTVQAGRGLYITRKADEDLMTLCRASKFAYVLTSRQVGKSSLMVRTAERLAEEGVNTVDIDLTLIGTDVSKDEWYLGLLTEIEDNFPLKTDVVGWWMDHTHLSGTHRLTRFFEDVLLPEIEGQIVIFIDEIDSTVSLPFSADDFFAAVRHVYNARASNPDLERLSFVLVGTVAPADLISDAKRTPFNIGARVELTDFTFEEARPLAGGFPFPIETGEKVLEWVLEWTGGHPYLTQRTCEIIAQQGGRLWTKPEVDALIREKFLSDQSQPDHNLEFVRDMLTTRAPDKIETINTYKSIRLGVRPVEDDETSVVKSHLKLSGAVKAFKGTLKIRNKIYAEAFNRKWIGEHLPRNVSVQRLALALVIVVVAFSAFAIYQQFAFSEALTEAQMTGTADSVASRETSTAASLASNQTATVDAAAVVSANATATAAIGLSQDALSRQLVAQAEAQFEKDQDLGLLLAVEAINAADTLEAQSTLFNFLSLELDARAILSGSTIQTVRSFYTILENTFSSSEGAMGVMLTGREGAIETIEFNEKGTQFATGSRTGSMILRDATPPFNGSLLNQHTSPLTALSFSLDGSTLNSKTTNSSGGINTQTFSGDSGGGGDSPITAVALTSLPTNLDFFFFNQPRALGLDVSRWSGEIDWQAVKDYGISFVYIRATIGEDMIDERFEEYWRGAGEAGLLRGAYHFFDNEGEPKVQADVFYTALDIIGDFGELPPVIDIEESPFEEFRILEMIEYVTGIFGQTPIIYTNRAWSELGGTDWAADFPLWTAQYPNINFDAETLANAMNNEPSMTLFTDWEDWTFWQFTGIASGEAIGLSSTGADLNVFNGTVNELFAYAGLMQDLEASGASNGIVEIFDTYNNKSYGRLIGPVTPVLDLEFRPGTTEIAALFDDDTLILWDFVSGEKQEFTANEVDLQSLTFSGNGQFIAAVSVNGGFAYWEIQDTGEITPLSHDPYDKKVTGIALNKDGLISALGFEDGSISFEEFGLFDESVRDVSDAFGFIAIDSTITFSGHSTPVTAMAFHPNDLLLISGDEAGNIIIWDPEPRSWARTSCEIAGRSLTEQEWNQFLIGREYQDTCEILRNQFLEPFPNHSFFDRES